MTWSIQFCIDHDWCEADINLYWAKISHRDCLLVGWPYDVSSKLGRFWKWSVAINNNTGMTGLTGTVLSKHECMVNLQVAYEQWLLAYG